MRLLVETRAGAALNLALDEALLNEAEVADQPLETLRFWLPAEPLVVLGQSSRIAVEVNERACREDGVSVLRRVSGGGTIVGGPGCLMYALVLSYELRPHLRSLDVCHRQVLGTTAAALAASVPGVELQGICDLTLGGRKFAGHAVRCRRSHLLYHGTLMYDFPLEWISRYLASATREPEYRRGRSHADFVTNLPMPAEELISALTRAWRASDPATLPPSNEIDRLVTERYSQASWTRKH